MNTQGEVPQEEEEDARQDAEQRRKNVRPDDERREEAGPDAVWDEEDANPSAMRLEAA